MTLCHNKDARIRIRWFLLAQTASLLRLNPSRGSFLRVIILFPRLPRKALAWLHPDLLSHVTWSADLSLPSARKPTKARQRSRRQLGGAFESTCAVAFASLTHQERAGPFRDLSAHRPIRWPTFTCRLSPLRFICRRDFVASVIILKGTCVNLPERRCAQI